MEYSTSISRIYRSPIHTVHLVMALSWKWSVLTHLLMTRTRSISVLLFTYYLAINGSSMTRPFHRPLWRNPSDSSSLSHAAAVLQLGDGGEADPRSFARENENAERMENIFLGLAGLMASTPVARSPRSSARNLAALAPHSIQLGDASPVPGTRLAGAAETGEQRGMRWSTPGSGIRLEVRSGIEAGAGRTRTWAYTTGGGLQESQGNAGAGMRNAANLPTNFPSFPE